METNIERAERILAELAASLEANHKEFQASLEASRKESQASRKEMEQLVKDNQKMMGRLGNQFGDFAEGLAYPTVERIMREEFGMEGVNPVHIRRKDGELELDAFGYANGKTNTVMVGEIKSHFRDYHVEQIEKSCQQLTRFMPEHQGKKVHGMFIFVKGDQNAIQLATKRGIYTVEANDENFKLRNAKGFVPRDFGV